MRLQRSPFASSILFLSVCVVATGGCAAQQGRTTGGGAAIGAGAGAVGGYFAGQAIGGPAGGVVGAIAGGIGGAFAGDAIEEGIREDQGKIPPKGQAAPAKSGSASSSSSAPPSGDYVQVGVDDQGRPIYRKVNP